MCLDIQIHRYNSGKKPNKSGFILAYKMIRFDNFNYYSNALRILNLEHSKYVLGENFSSRKNVKKCASEIYYIDSGFHLFSTLESARKNVRFNQAKIIRVYYKPEDVVAYGSFRNKFKSVVVTKLTVKSLEGIK